MKLRMKHILPIYFGFALLYLFFIPFRPIPLDFLVKAVPAFALAFWLWISVRGWIGKTLSTAMILSAFGDIALALQTEEATDYFMIGLGFFLLAHIIFIIVFLSDIRIKKSALPVIVLIPVFSIGMAILLAPHLGELKIPVFVYIGVISVMGIAAGLNNRGSVLLLLGALIFITSDSAIAVNRFLLTEPHPAGPYFIMVTYYVAQFMIALSFVKTEETLNVKQPMAA